MRLRKRAAAKALPACSRGFFPFRTESDPARVTILTIRTGSDSGPGQGGLHQPRRVRVRTAVYSDSPPSSFAFFATTRFPPGNVAGPVPDTTGSAAVDSGGPAASTMTPPAPPLESTDGRSSQEPAESVIDWADKLLARFPPEVYEGAVRSSQSSLCDLAFSVPPLGNNGRPEPTSGKPGIQRGFHRLCDPPDLMTAEM